MDKKTGRMNENSAQKPMSNITLYYCNNLAFLDILFLFVLHFYLTLFRCRLIHIIPPLPLPFFLPPNLYSFPSYPFPSNTSNTYIHPFTYTNSPLSLPSTLSPFPSLSFPSLPPQCTQVSLSPSFPYRRKQVLRVSGHSVKKT